MQMQMPNANAEFSLDIFFFLFFFFIFLFLLVGLPFFVVLFCEVPPFFGLTGRAAIGAVISRALE